MLKPNQFCQSETNDGSPHLVALCALKGATDLPDGDVGSPASVFWLASDVFAIRCLPSGTSVLVSVPTGTYK